MEAKYEVDEEVIIFAIFKLMEEEYKSIDTEPKELSNAALLWILGVMVITIALMFASILGKGYLFYGGVAFGFMTAVITHMTVYILSTTSRTTYILFLHGITWLIAISVAIFLRSSREDRELARFGVVYAAPVIDLYTVRGKKHNRESRFKARIRYVVRGKVYVKSVVNSDRILQISDTVRIVYSSEDPVLFGVTAFIKRKIPSSADTAKFKGMGGDSVSVTDPLARNGDRFPQFRGGPSAFYEYVRSNLIYPATGIVNRRAGEVHLSFIVDKDGTVKDVRVTKSIDHLYDEAAVKVLKESPKWLPGIRNGKPIKVKYNIPIRFSL
ncbi:MAG: energy transducer TonB [Pedobacter sp.]